jgi:HAMP domain-containing protein
MLASEKETSMRHVILGAALVALAGVPALADQAHMENALDNLHRARQQLEAAKPNKDGHRDQALEHVTKAISHVQKGREAAREQ